MFKTVIKIANVWVDATGSTTRAQARKLAKFYREGYVSPNVVTAKVVRVKGES
jgi:hypothetical protein